MSECFKPSIVIPVIVHTEGNDSEYVCELKDLMLQMTSFHDNERVHIGTVKDTLQHILCKLSSLQIMLNTINVIFTFHYLMAQP